MEAHCLKWETDSIFFFWKEGNSNYEYANCIYLVTAYICSYGTYKYCDLFRFC